MAIADDVLRNDGLLLVKLAPEAGLAAELGAVKTSLGEWELLLLAKPALCARLLREVEVVQTLMGVKMLLLLADLALVSELPCCQLVSCKLLPWKAYAAQLGGACCLGSLGAVL